MGSADTALSLVAGRLRCLGLGSGETENYDPHQWLGYSVIVLVVSRISWGFIGSPHSRFADFLVGPGRLLAYLKGERARSAGQIHWAAGR